MGSEDRQEVCENTQGESGSSEKEAREAAIDWKDVTNAVPEDESLKELFGYFQTKGLWDKKTGTWQVSPNEKISFEAKKWKDIENGSDKKEEISTA